MTQKKEAGKKLEVSFLIEKIRKRNGEEVKFNIKKVENAIFKAIKETKEGKKENATKVSEKVLKELEKRCKKDKYCIPKVEEIQDLVEVKLMESKMLKTAKAYIIYRNLRSEKRKLDIFKKRVNLKPFEYPNLAEYSDAIRSSYWVHTEFNFTSDIQDFKTKLSGKEKAAIKKAMLAISQIEVSVKTFWGKIHDKLPKPEIAAVGYTFAESEVRHQDAYSHLLEILGLNKEFEKINEILCIKDRVKYLEDAIKNINFEDNKEYTHSVLLFSLFIEHVSLFSQFLIIMSFNKYKNVLKGISNVVEATSKEEQIHGLFGIDIIKIIKEENPSWFDTDYNKKIYNACVKAYDAEENIIDWIFQDGELDFLPKKVIKEFIKERFNNSLHSIGLKKIFDVDEKLVSQTEWFDDEVIATKHVDFFAKRSINYTKRSKSITEDDLF